MEELKCEYRWLIEKAELAAIAAIKTASASGNTDAIEELSDLLNYWGLRQGKKIEARLSSLEN